MAYNGVLVESRIQATNIDALNRSAVCSSNDIAGGGLVQLTAPSAQGNNVWTAALPTAVTGLWIAYNPSEKLTLVNGKYFAGLSADPRDYTNLATRPMDVFKPKVGDEIVVTIDAIDSTGSATVNGDFIEAKTGQSTFTRVAAATGAAASTTAFQVEWVGNMDFPQAGIGMQQYKCVKAVCVQE
jgi:hypothetical protein